MQREAKSCDGGGGGHFASTRKNHQNVDVSDFRRSITCVAGVKDRDKMSMRGVQTDVQRKDAAFNKELRRREAAVKKRNLLRKMTPAPVPVPAPAPAPLPAPLPALSIPVVVPDDAVAADDVVEDLFPPSDADEESDWENTRQRYMDSPPRRTERNPLMLQIYATLKKEAKESEEARVAALEAWRTNLREAEDARRNAMEAKRQQARAERKKDQLPKRDDDLEKMFDLYNAPR